MIQEPKVIKEFLPFPVYTDRKSWDVLPEQTKQRYIAEAKKLKGQEWTALPAVLYMDFYRNGNRSRFQSRYYGRRRNLLILMIAECIEGKGEYLDDIINGVWMICEETSWVIPAHINHDQYGTGAPPKELPDIEGSLYVDLFAAETGSLLSWIYYFLGDPIAVCAPLVKRRMELEAERRLLTPYLEHNDFSWMGLNHDKPVNNWNPWINSNMLVSYLIFAKSFPTALEGAVKTIRSINRFIDFYANDGGCDEGPSYFSKAGASLFDFIEELGQVTDVSYLYTLPKIRSIVAYIYKVYIGKTFYVNYADASPTVFVPLGVLERAGKNTGNDMLLGFTRYLREHAFCHPDDTADSGAYSIYRLLAGIFADPSETRKKFSFKIPRLSWFEGIQVVTARDQEDSLEGIFFSAKGGHNDESHNHNDVGNFLLYCDGIPALVDAGVEAYTKFTFNEMRYTLWTMQSCYHNTPTINGQDQAPGPQYRAVEASLTSADGLTRFSLDIAGAYPAEAYIQSYRREFVLQYGQNLTITDTYSLKEWRSSLIVNLLCYEKPEISGDTVVLSGKISMRLDGSVLVSAIEEIPLTDKKILDDWQQKKQLYRLRLTKQGQERSGQVTLRFTKIGT